MKTLSREEIKRISDSPVSSGSGGGGSTNVGVSQGWVEENFISKEFFDSIFQLYNNQTKIEPNGQLPVDQSQLNIKAMFGFWTEQYISALGQGSSGGGGGATALVDLVDVAISSPVAGQALVYDGMHWVNGIAFAVSNPSNGQALVYNSTTGKWTNGAATAGTVTSVGMTVPTGLNVSPSSITSSGTFTITFASGYSIPTTAKQSNWDTAYTNNHTHSNKSVLDGISSTKVSNWDAAYLYRTALNVSRTAWGQTFWNDGPANVSGALISVTNISMSGRIDGAISIELNSGGELSGYGGFIDFHFDGDSSDYTTRLIEETSGVLRLYGSLRIGNAVLSYDSANNALKVAAQDGTAANFYATGGVSALGMSNGGGIIDTLNVGTAIKMSDYGGTSLDVVSVTKATSSTTVNWLNIGGGWNTVYHNTMISGYNITLSANGNALTIDSTGKLTCPNYLQASRYYLDSTRYIYVSSGKLYYNNGSTSEQISS